MVRKSVIGLTSFFALGAALLYWVLFPPIVATHPALTSGALPQTVPLRAFYADPASRWRFRLSPDGTRIAWLEAKRLKPALWVSDLGPAGPTQADIFHTPDVVRWFQWSADSRYLLYLADRDGWENDVLVSIDVTKPGSAPRSYSFGKGVRTWIENVPANGGAEILVAHNARDTAKFDLYRLNLDSGETTALDLISDRSVSWRFDRDGTLFARTIQGEGGAWRTELRGEDGTFEQITSGEMGDNFWVISDRNAEGRILAITNMDRDLLELVWVDPATKAEEVLYAPERTDMSWVITHPVTDAPLMAMSYPDRQEQVYFQDSARKMVALLGERDGGSVHLVSSTHDFTKAIWEVEHDRTGWTSYLVDNVAGTATQIQRPGIATQANELSSMEPVFITARDGLRIPALLTRAKGVTDPGPMVILIHGGPHSRSTWGWRGMTLWLANRGYSVLDVNYRGSTGYGRTFIDAMVGEVSRKAHQDILDARTWAIEQSIADPDKIAVLGGSWGGLKTLTALTQSPDLFAAGVSINGLSDLSTMLEEFPEYWTGTTDWATKFMGDFSDPTVMADIKNRSPLTHAARVSAPVMVIQGTNDVRVVRSQSDRMVKALQEAGKNVTYELIDGAGHTFANMTWQEKMIMHRKIERFLAMHLGGRADGFDYAHFGAHIIP